MDGQETRQSAKRSGEGGTDRSAVRGSLVSVGENTAGCEIGGCVQLFQQGGSGRSEVFYAIRTHGATSRAIAEVGRPGWRDRACAGAKSARLRVAVVLRCARKLQIRQSGSSGVQRDESFGGGPTAPGAGDGTVVSSNSGRQGGQCGCVGSFEEFANVSAAGAECGPGEAAGGAVGKGGAAS